MTPLVRASLLVQRLAGHAWALVLALALGAGLVLHGTRELPAPLVLGMVGTYAVLVLRRLRGRARAGSLAPITWVLDAQLGTLAHAVVLIVVRRVDGGLDGPFYPLFYVLVTVVAAFARPSATLAVAAWLLGIEAAVAVLAGRFAPDAFLSHVGFVSLFAAQNLVFLRAEVARMRTRARGRIEDEITRLKDDARRYRLLGAGEDERDPAKAEDRLARSSVEEIHQSVHYALDLLRRTLDLNTAVLLWQNDAGTHLRISELSTGDDEIHDAPIRTGDGVLGAVMVERKSVSLENLRPSYHVPYYAGPCPVRTLLAIPVMEDDHVRGVLAVDRKSARAFSPQEEELCQQAARYCHRAIQNERVFLQLERAKVEQGKLYRAAKGLGAALTEAEVLSAGVRAAREIASFDLAAVTVYDEEKKVHEVCAATSKNGEIDDLVGARFNHNAGLVSMVVQNRFPLPYKGEFDATHQVVLTRRFPWPRLPSLLVLPLVLHDRALGTLILGSHRPHAFGDSVRPTLEVLASHLGVSLSNARMVQKLETLAKEDGLTRLLNKRALLEEADAKILAATRFARKLSLLVVDIDHFTRVNAVHGHDVGDLVITGLADVLRRHKRTTDVVARYGGEEFVVLCEQTDEPGAMLLAERIRTELEKTAFHTRGGKLSVTCSLGVATFPEAGTDFEGLFKSADLALYTSKRGGRNRATLFERRNSELRLREGTPVPEPQGSARPAPVAAKSRRAR